MLAINRARSLSERTGEPKSDIRPTPNGDCRRRGRGENISRVKLRGKEWGGRSPQAIENCGSESERRSLQRLPLAFDVFSAHVPEADFWPQIIWGWPVIRPEPVPTTHPNRCNSQVRISRQLDNASLGSRRRRCRSERAVPSPPVLKITQCVLIGLENSPLCLILLGLSRITGN